MVPLSNVARRTFAQINVHLLFCQLSYSSFCTISLLLLLMLIVVAPHHTHTFPQNVSQRSLMTDRPRLQLDNDEILFTGMFRSWLVCAGLHSWNGRLIYYYFSIPSKVASIPQSPQSYCAALKTWQSFKKTQVKTEHRGPPPSRLLFQMLEIVPIILSIPQPQVSLLASKRHFLFTAS